MKLSKKELKERNIEKVEKFHNTFLRHYELKDTVRYQRINNYSKLLSTTAKGPLAVLGTLLVPYKFLIPGFLAWPLAYKIPLMIGTYVVVSDLF